MKHMTLSEFIDSESDEPVFIVDGPQPIVGTRSFGTAKEWVERIYGGPCGGTMKAAHHSTHSNR